MQDRPTRRHTRTRPYRAAAPLLAAAALLGCSPAAPPVEEPPAAPTAPLHEDVILTPEGLGMIDSGQRDVLGRPIPVRCSTCHEPTAPATMNSRADQLDEFHQGLSFEHGKLACAACHNPDDRDTLRLATGEALPFERVMDLCAQCHGPQRRDYAHGAHGGMQGHWDRAAGPRVRNTCIHCHDPHAPAFPTVQPAPAPLDAAPPQAAQAHGAPHE